MLTERQYVVRVTALLDRSTAAAAGDLVQTYDKAAKAAGRRISEEERASRQAARERERAEKHVAGIKDRYFRDQQRQEEAQARRAERESTQRARREEAAVQRTQRAKERAEEQAGKAQERAAERAAIAKQRAEERAQRYVERVRDRYYRDEQRRQEREERSTVRDRKAAIKGFATDAIGNAAAAGRKAMGVAGEITSGLGVDFSLGAGVSKAVSLEKMAVAIVNAGNRGTGSAAQRDADVTDLQNTARSIGNKYAFDPTQVLGGLAKYQALTGDLDTAKAGLGDLAALAKAFNTDLDKMVGAAGQVGSAIGEVGEGKTFANAEEKAKAVLDVLKSLTAQGQEGAVEISDLATQMAKLKAAGAAFEGSTAENIKKMGAMAQLSLQLGGSASATQAATSVMGFVSTLKTPARRKEFAAAGVDIDSATEKGAFADPFEIIKRSLTATKGDPEAMKKLFANVVGERAVTALTNTYNKAGGGDKGMAAVDDQFKRFRGTVTDKVMQENLARAMNTKESKAQVVQNQIDERWAQLSERVLPAFERMAPAAMKVIDSFAGLVEFVSNNLKLSIGLAIAGSIGKAAIGPLIGKAIGESIASAGLSNALGKALGGLGGLGIAGGLAITAATVYLAAKDFVDKSDKAEADLHNTVEKGAPDLVTKAKAQLAATGKVDKDTLDQLAMQRANLEGLRNADQKTLSEGKLGWVASAWANMTESPETAARMAETEGQVGYASQNKGEIEALINKMDQVFQAVKENKQKGPIDVNIVGGVVAAPGNGRQGIPDQGT